jgi:hypothetical protein
MHRRVCKGVAGWFSVALLVVADHLAFTREFVTSFYAGPGETVQIDVAKTPALEFSEFLASRDSRVVLRGNSDATVRIRVIGKFVLDGATIVLEGGIRANSVIFALDNNDSAAIRRITEGSVFVGQLMSIRPALRISESKVNGRVIRGSLERTAVSPLLPPPRPRGPVGP